MSPRRRDRSERDRRDDCISYATLDMAMSANTSPNKQEQAYAALRERILSGSYSPGYRLVIDALAEELGVSALPIREAIRRLEAEGLVVFRPNAGAQVAPADPALFEDMMVGLAFSKAMRPRSRRRSSSRLTSNA